MPISYSFSDGVVRFLISGEYDFKDALPMITESLKDTQFKRSMNFLIDVRNTVKNRTTEEAFEFIDFIKSRCEFEGTKIAVVTSRPVSYGLARMVSVFLEEFDISLDVFRNLSDAEQWLKKQ